MPLPVSAKEFVKHPIAYVLYFCIAAIGIMYVDLKVSRNNELKQIRKDKIDCQTNYYTLSVEVKELRSEYVKFYGGYKELKSELETLKKLGVVKE